MSKAKPKLSMVGFLALVVCTLFNARHHLSISQTVRPVGTTEYSYKKSAAYHRASPRAMQLIGTVGPRSGQPAPKQKSRWIPVAAADDFKPAVLVSEGILNEALPIGCPRPSLHSSLLRRTSTSLLGGHFLSNVDLHSRCTYDSALSITVHF
ncbi:hypothetical protein J3F83DRAFT_482659 [Trichoderma novae-zelandiae]